ncbi:uncharacterized protein Z520_04207 [Fonsecaea multimorphosa CBS 102226]|uniref:NAD(P)-binding domain-containing protein n=1 Tax=Fonsecaea multimorphosa CBS 102226 TaxID=1442371 RepID=A0A0D2IU46_9EURO|nr:uncharacterized protein Z520_04207 [Fonsecaea multimorphosa CBS 102226]KIY00522.1 hypothetical protein Z520_04207 [Fonsecaea multimorphosa CBS 102226]OAL27038.1 hypothetical protein AYO22_03982 [Fonsecaea multimorphosa]
MSSPTAAFFGATGGVTNAILVHTLKAGYKAVALVRTPQKLRDQLSAQGLSSEVLENLTIVQGNALDVAAVRRTLLASATTGTAGVPSVVVTGLGGSPKLQFDWRHPFQIANLDNPSICETAAQTLLTAMHEIYAENPVASEKKPLLAFISTTGITRGPEDVPFWIRFLYHQMLTVPHIDKHKMEDLYRADADSASSNPVFRNIVGVRPTLLSGGADYRDTSGSDKVIKSGIENKPAIGYIIKRADVGAWVYENVVSEALQGRKGRWEGEMVSLTT